MVRKNEFALVESTACYSESSISEELQRGQLLAKLEVGITCLFDLSDDAIDVGAMWAAISSAVSQKARKRLGQVGCDADIDMESINKYFLTHPV